MKYLSIAGIFMVFSCGLHRITVLGDHSKDFSKKQIGEIRERVDPEKNLTEIVIGVIEFSDSIKVGLYSCKMYKSPQSVQILYKVLKFEDRIVFPSADEEKNKAQLKEFENSYSRLFTQQQIDHIKESFLKGAEISGRTL